MEKVRIGMTDSTFFDSTMASLVASGNASVGSLGKPKLYNMCRWTSFARSHLRKSTRRVRVDSASGRRRLGVGSPSTRSRSPAIDAYGIS